MVDPVVIGASPRRARLRLREFLRSADGTVPAGQRAVVDFPRFGDRPMRGLPAVPVNPVVRIAGAVESPADVPFAALHALARHELTADFNCVTTWCVRGLRWGGIRFRSFYEDILVPRCRPSADVGWLRIVGLDGASAFVALEDALGDDVLLADCLDGEPLTLVHGAPLRFVSPAQYAYKSVKHVASIELCVDRPVSTAGAKEHPRARVALEERHSRYPAWLVRWPYRLIAPLTALLAERSASRTGRGPGGLRSLATIPPGSTSSLPAPSGAPSRRHHGSSSTTHERNMTMGLQIGDTAPDFEADTTEGRISFHNWIGDSWAVLFSHPKDFTPVCTTELGYMATLKPEFERRGVKIIGLSVDATSDHEAWANDIEETQGARPNYPIIGDADFNVSKLYAMLPANTSGDPKTRTPADNQTVRNVFVIGPDKKVKLILVYPMTTGRNFDEVLRVVDSLQLTANHRVATPVNWQQGEDVIIAGSVSNDEAKQIFGTWTEPKPYIRIVPQPA